uniref:Uncharacterized protein n=1 Tax=Meloidogyne enterolobii TaxID=390850 RepID=A0A6V7WFC5_MELEN|nr:unnamed protein product [Meloidogyne enterolobii]
MERLFLFQKRGSVSLWTNWGVTYFVWDELRGVYCHIGGLLGVYWEIGGLLGGILGDWGVYWEIWSNLGVIGGLLGGVSNWGVYWGEGGGGWEGGGGRGVLIRGGVLITLLSTPIE